MEENFIICKLSQTESNNVELTNQLTNIINRAFRKTESDMWEKRIKRTNIQDVSHYIYDEEMVCVYKKSKHVGCMRLQRVTKGGKTYSYDMNTSHTTTCGKILLIVYYLS